MGLFVDSSDPKEIKDLWWAHSVRGTAQCKLSNRDAGLKEFVTALDKAFAAQNEAADLAEVEEHCRERLAAFKVPAAIHVLDEIPRTATGKVQRRRVGAVVTGQEPG